jgi:hypothetical protein
LSNPNGNGRAAKDIIGRVLGYMDRPWKAVVVLVFLVIIGLGWFVWHERERVIAVLEDRPIIVASLKRGEFRPILMKLVDETDIDIAALWSVDLSSNTASFEVGQQRGGKPWIFTPSRVPFLLTTSTPKTFIELLAGNVTCADLTDPDAPLMKRLSMQTLADAGMKRVCVTPIPPDPELLLGVLVIAWKNPHNSEQEAVAISAATLADRKLVRWYAE